MTRLVDRLTANGLSIGDAEELIEEMYHANVIVARDSDPGHAASALPDVFPIQTLVMNLTNQCNLSCQYCYEFGADKVATPEGKPKFMDVETAKTSVDFLLAQSGDRRSVHITFFGGETLMNFPLLKEVVAYANRRAAEQERHIDFSLTTNATLLTPAIIEFLSENHIGVTVSMDGPKEMHDHLRVFANGKGSYDIIEPKVRALIQNHRTRPITARVTLTAGVSDVIRIFRHLKQDLGFHEVGFAPVTTSPNQLYAIGATGMDSVLGPVPRAGRRISGVRAARRIARIFERQRYAGRAVPGREQIASLRRGPGPARRGTLRRHRAVPPLC